jgi:hypothetical protein
MAILTTQGKHMMGILKKIKEYPDYKKHLPTITSGMDTYTGYIDYYLIEQNYSVADMLFIQTIMPLPGTISNHDYTLIVLNPNTITITYDNDYYDFEPTKIPIVDGIGIDIGVFYRTLLRIAEYGCLHWGFPFKKYALRMTNTTYASGIRSLNCDNDNIFALQSNVFIPGSVGPITLGVLSSAYDDITAFYIPMIYLNVIGAQLNIYPDKLLESFSNLMHERKLFQRPAFWLTAKERRKSLMPPYSVGQIIYYQDLMKSFISLIPDNIEDPANKDAWKEIDFSNPRNNELIPSEITDPVEELLRLFDK